MYTHSITTLLMRAGSTTNSQLLNEAKNENYSLLKTVVKAVNFSPIKNRHFATDACEYFKTNLL